MTKILKSSGKNDAIAKIQKLFLNVIPALTRATNLYDSIHNQYSLIVIYQ